jgi:hypothetical protein
MPAAKSDLWKFLDAKAKPSRLLGNIERHLLLRPVGDRDYTVLHPSDMIKKDWCKRGSYFLLKGHERIAEKPNLKLQSIFDEGHAIHAKWQNWFQEMGVLHGKFRCVSCLEITWGTSPEECGKCGWKTLEYAEVTLVDKELRIAGHTDGWIKGIGDDCLIEIKSIGPGTIRSEAPGLMMDADGDFMKAWGNVRKPFAPHVMQGQLYLELMKRMGNDVNEIVFLYELKADQSYKEFSVTADYELVRHVFEGAKEVVDAVNANVVPDCSNQPGGVCKQCAPYKEK